MRRFTKAIGLILAIFLAGLYEVPGNVLADENNPEGKIKIGVSILPQACFVDRIGQDFVDIMVLVGPGQSPATYEPSPKQMAKLSQTDIYFGIGVPFEKRLLKKISRLMNDLEIVDTRHNIQLRHMESHRHDDDSNENCEGKTDPHTWLNPLNVKKQTEVICSTLCRIAPEHKDFFIDNANLFKNELDSVDAQIQTILQDFNGRGLFVFHPAFGYFTDRYGLRQIAIQVEGKEPGTKQLAGILEQVRLENADAIIIQKQFSKTVAKAIAGELNCEIITLDPLSADYLSNLIDMAYRIKDVLSAEKGGP